MTKHQLQLAARYLGGSYLDRRIIEAILDKLIKESK